MIPLRYEVARHLAELSIRKSHMVRVGPRIVAALLGEIDDSHRQVASLVDAFGSAGDGLMAANRERLALRQALELTTQQRDSAMAESARLRARLAQLHPGVSP